MKKLILCSHNSISSETMLTLTSWSVQANNQLLINLSETHYYITNLFQGGGPGSNDLLFTVFYFISVSLVWWLLCFLMTCVSCFYLHGIVLPKNGFPSMPFLCTRFFFFQARDRETMDYGKQCAMVHWQLQH
jgi:hypothetical protein